MDTLHVIGIGRVGSCSMCASREWFSSNFKEAWKKFSLQIFFKNGRVQGESSVCYSKSKERICFRSSNSEQHMGLIVFLADILFFVLRVLFVSNPRLQSLVVLRACFRYLVVFRLPEVPSEAILLFRYRQKWWPCAARTSLTISTEEIIEVFCPWRKTSALPPSHLLSRAPQLMSTHGKSTSRERESAKEKNRRFPVAAFSIVWDTSRVQFLFFYSNTHMSWLHYRTVRCIW